jgi:hypothetical protein
MSAEVDEIAAQRSRLIARKQEIGTTLRRLANELMQIDHKMKSFDECETRRRRLRLVESVSGSARAS